MVNLKRLGQSFKYAKRGLFYTLKSHQNLRVHLFLAGVVIIAGALLKISFGGWVALLIGIFLVLMAEMINTALEEIINLVKEDHSEKARIAKDVSAGMVLLAAIFAIVIGLLVFIPYLPILN